MCMFCMRLSQLHVCDARVFDVQLKSVIKDHVFMRFFLYTYMSQLAICDACVLHAQLSSGIKVHVFMCMFCTRIFQLLVCNARVVVVVQ